jgi:sigma-B regulation protein RsbU (phosphoserine phosphatase)
MHEARPQLKTQHPDEADGEVLVALRGPARAERLKDIRAAVGEAALRCGCAEEVAQDIVLAVDEACQNVIRHAYGGAPGGEMIVQVRRTGDGMEVSLTDFAETVDPATIKPRSLDDVRPGGLGTHFINQIMDEVQYLVPPGGRGNQLRMVKRIA